MINFKQFLENFKKKYVCVCFTDETNTNLRKYAQDLGFDLTKNYNQDTIDPKDFEFHTTVFFTNSEHNTPDQEIKIDKPFKVKAKEFNLLGADENIPVLSLEIPEELQQIRKKFEDQGYKDSWGDYHPHITLSYNKQKYDLKKLKLPNFPIVVNTLKVQTQSEKS